MKYIYDNLIEGLNGLKQRGFLNDFNIEGNLTQCKVLNKNFTPDDFKIVEYIRFGDGSDVSDSSILYPLETNDEHKGVLLDAYGSASGIISVELLKRSNFNYGNNTN